MEPSCGRPPPPADIRTTERFAQSVLPMAMLSLEGELVHVNDAFCRLVGRERGHLIGTPVVDLAVAGDGAEGAAHILKAVQAGQVGGELDQRLLCPTGDVVDVQLAWTLLRDESGAPSYLTLVLIDMTERRQQQAQLAASEARFRARFEQSSVAQVMASTEGRITAVNTAFCALLGRQPEQLVGAGNVELHHPLDEGLGDAALAAVLSGERETARYERLLKDADGRPLPALVDITLLRDVDGEPDEIALTVFDLRTLRDVERRREQQEQFFLAVSQRASDLALVADSDAMILFASGATRHMFGYEADEVIAQLGWDFVHPDDLDTAQAAFEQVVGAGGTGGFTVRVRDAEGSWRWVEATMVNMLDTPVGGIVTNLHDVTERRAAEQALRESEARYRLIADTAEEGILAVTTDGSCLYANARMAAMLGLPLSDLYARSLPSLLEPAERTEMLRRLREREGGEPESYEVRYVHPDGGERRFWIAASPMLGPDGEHQGSLGMVSDVTELRRTEEQLRRAALHDGLTGLPNRTLLSDRLHQALSREAATGSRGTAVVLLDLDDFKLVNDSRGHAVGDSLLVAVVERLVATARPLDTVARFGGDEFVVVCEDVDEATALALAEGLLAALREPFDVDGNVLHVSASFGVARAPGSAAEDLLRFADAAMYVAKDAGRGRVALFDRTLADEADRRYSLAADLRAALQQERLRLHYQPVVDLGSGRVVAMEALARWEHPEVGDVPPGRFVAVAEQTGLAVKLDAWAAGQAMRDTAALRDAGVIDSDVSVAVNLSARSLVHPDLEQAVVDAAAAAGLPPRLVTLEITESAVMEDAELAVQVLRRLRGHGFGIAVDDFGTGYSSLAYLRDLPITSIKIDRSFVAGISEDRDAHAIVASIVDLARAIDVTVVAEGVETQEQAALLRQLGCPVAQGWLWSPALALDQVQDASVTWRSGYPVGAAKPARAPHKQPAAWLVSPEHGGERLLQLHREGASLTTIAAALNSEGFRTPAGARWHRTTVARTVAQAAYPELTDSGSDGATPA